LDNNDFFSPLRQQGVLPEQRVLHEQGILPQQIPADALSQDDHALIQIKLWRLLSRQTELFTLGDSSSVPTEVAQDLFESIIFTLSISLGGSYTQKALLSEDLNALHARGVTLLEGMIAEGKRLWDATHATMPQVESRALVDTLRGIGVFFKRYDHRFRAHQIPCDIDYQLCRPVPESERGIAYINEYLRRIIAENRVLRAFEPVTAKKLLISFSPDYTQLIGSLCEPLLTNALGLSLIGKSPFPLDITGADRAEIASLLKPLKQETVSLTLKKAADRFCDAAGITDAYTRSYVSATAEALGPFLYASVTFDSLTTFLPSFLPE